MGVVGGGGPTFHIVGKGVCFTHASKNRPAGRRGAKRGEDFAPLRPAPAEPSTKIS